MNSSQLARGWLFLLPVSLLSDTLSAEVFPGKAGFDQYGGYVSYEGKATGRFRLDQLKGRHFLVTPEGHGFVSLGVTHTGALARPADLRHDYLKQKLGGDWGRANQELLANFRRWGYNSLGYDSHSTTQRLLPYFASCQPTGNVSSWMGGQIEFPDVFADDWKADARAILEETAEQSEIGPNLIGIYWTDMPAWDLADAKRTVGQTWVDAIRELPADAPGKIRYEQFLRDEEGNANDEEFLRLIAREVYSFIGPLTRELFPETLIFGERYAERALPLDVIREALPWIDIVSVQPGGAEFPAETLGKLHQTTEKPVMICDHQASFPTPEYPKVMWQTLSDVSSVAAAHADYLEAGFSTPYLVGYHRCQYIDRFNPRQNLLKQGLLQADGKPYAELVESVQRNNWQTHARFLGGSDETGEAKTTAPKPDSETARWESAIKEFEAADVESTPPENAILLVGGSNARRWTDVNKYFPGRKVINRGFGGARLADVLHYMDRIVLPYRPDTILLNAGGNDLSSGASPEQIRDRTRAFLEGVHGVLPDTRIYTIGLPLVRRSFQRPEVRDAIVATNARLAELAETSDRVEYVDLGAPLLDEEGRFRPELYVEDGIHFSPKGYAVVSELIRKRMDE